MEHAPKNMMDTADHQPARPTSLRLTSRIVPYSSIVGGGLLLDNPEGRPVFTVMFAGTSDGISEEQTAALARQFKTFIETHGLEVPL